MTRMGRGFSRNRELAKETNRKVQTLTSSHRRGGTLDTTLVAPFAGTIKGTGAGRATLDAEIARVGTKLER